MSQASRSLATFFASGFGAGYVPFGPGTWGTAVGVLMLYLGNHFGLLDNCWSLLVITIVWSALGYVAILGLPKTWIHDDGKIVVDEVVGLFVTMLWLPLDIKILLMGFVLFRILDIWKPMGIRKFDNYKGEWSVIVDDLVAGVYANVILRGLLILLGWI